MTHVWEWFLELDDTRTSSGMGGLDPITHTEMTAWAEGMEIEVTPFERKAIRAIDKAYRIHVNTRAKKENG